MIDFSPVSRREITLAELVDGMTVDDLRRLTNEMIDRQLELIEDCLDFDVVYVPEDKRAMDKFAATPEETYLAWTLGHVVVHVTASSEEAAFIAAEMARGVEREGRSRYETPWSTVTTIAGCRERLEESRRMRLALLEAWPDEPHLEVTIHYPRLHSTLNAVGRFTLGLMHDNDHLGQIADIARQARAARNGTPLVVSAR